MLPVCMCVSVCGHLTFRTHRPTFYAVGRHLETSHFSFLQSYQLARLQASSTVQSTSPLFRDLTRRMLTVGYEHFRETCRAHLQGSGKVQYVELEIDAIGRKPWLVSQAPCIYFLIMLCHVTQYLKYNCNTQAWCVKHDSKVPSLCFAFRLNVWLAG